MRGSITLNWVLSSVEPSSGYPSRILWPGPCAAFTGEEERTSGVGAGGSRRGVWRVVRGLASPGHAALSLFGWTADWEGSGRAGSLAPLRAADYHRRLRQRHTARRPGRAARRQRDRRGPRAEGTLRGGAGRSGAASSLDSALGASASAAANRSGLPSASSPR